MKNPPAHMEHNGKFWMIHMSFESRAEADEESRAMRDSGYSTRVFKVTGGYAVYEQW